MNKIESAIGLAVFWFALCWGNGVHAQEPARQVYDRGMALFHEQDYAGAIPHLNQALRLDPHFEDAYIGLFLSKKFMGDTLGAIAAISQAMAVDSTSPNSYIYWEYRARVYRDMGRYAEALRDFQIAARKCTTCHQSPLELGELYYLMQDYPNAIRYLSKAINRHPWNENIYCKRGMAYYQMGNRIQACRDFETAAQKGSSEAKYRLRAYFPTLSDQVAAIFAFWH